MNARNFKWKVSDAVWHGIAKRCSLLSYDDFTLAKVLLEFQDERIAVNEPLRDFLGFLRDNEDKYRSLVFRIAYALVVERKEHLEIIRAGTRFLSLLSDFEREPEVQS